MIRWIRDCPHKVVELARRLPTRWYRDLWLVLISVVLLFTVKALADEVNEQRNGRKTGTTITCVITSSILRGSHAFIVASSAQALPAKLEARLLKEGFPPKEAREKAAVVQADAYTKAIGDAVVEAVGSKAKGLIVEVSHKRDFHASSAGTVNCAQLKTLTKAR
jgi:mRNA-degrading endonuclease toxin of MazEF toxin-antitoxin module